MTTWLPLGLCEAEARNSQLLHQWRSHFLTGKLDRRDVVIMADLLNTAIPQI